MLTKSVTLEFSQGTVCPVIEIEIALIAFNITIRDILVGAVALTLLHIVSYPVIFYVIWQICLYVTSKSSDCF